MSLIVNHNLMAANAARNLSSSYSSLSTSIQRLSSGLRINNAADDAAGLAIREMMRADIATTMQGLRNAADAISLIQTADGALAVIDEKLIRMKELAEQAATGTYTTAQREIINSEYQAMVREIDRIANATNFNGVKLLDGSISNMHGGQGMKIHFGVGNSEAEDYYFINMGDARATSPTGLRIGGDAKNDIWGQGAAGAAGLGGPGCCTAGFETLDGPASQFKNGESFSYGYNWDWMAQNDPTYANGAGEKPGLLSGKYLAGRYTVQSGESLQDLIDKVNAGTQSRVGIKIKNESGAASELIRQGGDIGVCVGDEAYIWGDLAAAEGGSAMVSYFNYTASLASAFGLTTALFGNSDSTYPTFLTSSLALAGALGFSSAILSTTLKNAPNSAEALKTLNTMLDLVKNGSQLLTATSAKPGMVSGYNLQSADDLYHFALSFLKPVTTTPAGVPTSMSAGALFNYLRTEGKIKLSAGSGHDWSALANTGVTMTSADFNSATVTSAGTVVFSAEGLYIASDGTWTTNSSLGKLLGVTVANSSKITVTKGELIAAGLSVPIADTDALKAAVTAFMQTKAADTQYADDINDPNGDVTLFMGHHASAGSEREGLWTTSGGIATILDFKSATISFADASEFLDLFSATTGRLDSGNVSLGGVALDDTALAAMGNRVIALGVSAGGTIETGLYYISGSTYWTEDLELGRALAPNGMKELRLTLGADINSIIAELRPVMAQMINEVSSDIAKIALNRPTGAEFAQGLMSRSRENKEERLEGFIDQSKANNIHQVGAGTAGEFNACSLASAINHNSASSFWAMLDSNDNSVLYVFRKDGGDNNDLLACEVTNIDEVSRKLTEYVDFEHVENGKWHDSGTTFSLGTTAAQVWGKMKPLQTKESMGNEVWNVTLNGRDVGDERDLWIAAAGELKLPGINLGDGFNDAIINGLDRYSFVELQNAESGSWAGADVRTQSNAQAALDALNYSIDVKDKIRADLGALQNRLENTMTNLEIQAENLQASESRISDVDVAKEMTEFTKNNVLVQAAVGMLAQANSLGQLALSLMR